jgi:hypothetical protein
VPIPEEYKFEVEKKSIPRVAKMIRCCLNNYKKAYKDFDEYRMVIRREPETFLENLKMIFGRKK